MVNTMSEDIIADPRAAVTKLFDAACKDGTPDLSTDFTIPHTFEAAFSDLVQLQKIPRLDKLSTSSLKTGTLVRFLGMVQDTSFSQEIYIGATRKDTKWTCHRYETANIDVDINSPDAILDERTGIYATSVPGAARWLEPTSLDNLTLEDVPAVLNGDKDRIVLAGQPEIGVVVKCYSGVENSVKVCDLVEIIGILEYPEPDEEEGRVDVVIHAITLKKKKLDEIVLSTREKLSQRTSPSEVELMVAEMNKARDLFIHHLANLFEGDDLAAQSILLNLTSPLTHRTPIPLGHLPLNIYSTPSRTTKALTPFLQSVLPALAIQPLAIDLLNKNPLYPRSDGEKLFAGRGQYVSRTVLVIDEAGLQEGKLGDTGVRNLRFLSRIPVAQKLGFEFPYHEFDIDTDLSFLVLGESKSILPVTPPLNLTNAEVSIAFPHVRCETSGEKEVLSSEDTKMLQTYLAQLSQIKVIGIDETIADEMQSSFVKARKEGGKDVDETWFGTRIVVAKGLARLNAREMMTREDWRDSLRICAQWEGRRKVANGI